MAIANAQAHDELSASRARVVASADETRRRIERDLHDGAQQQFVSLALKLRAVQASVPPGQATLANELGRIAAGLADALDDLRELSRGIHPAILTEVGLEPALRALARRSRIPVRLDVRTDDRLPERAEVTAYYIISEALANTAKHANATAVRVEVDATPSAVRLAVRDDGVGGADPARGTGLLGLYDRVEAAGGTLILHSPPGKGTELLADSPCNPHQHQTNAVPPRLAPAGTESGGQVLVSWWIAFADSSDLGTNPATGASWIRSAKSASACVEIKMIEGPPGLAAASRQARSMPLS